MGIFILVSLLFLSQPLMAFAELKTIEIPIERAFIPHGFDDNDRAQVVITGTLPDTCHQLGPHYVEPRGENDSRLVIHQGAYVYGGTCIKTPIQYQAVINFEMLEEGTYEIFDGLNQNRLGKLPVARALHAGSGKDDFPYAPVKEVRLLFDQADGNWVISLNGEFPDSCYQLRDVIFDYSKDVIVVQPIAIHQDPKKEGCQVGKFPYQVSSRLDESIHQGTYLVHVRKMNGDSFNQIFNLDRLKAFPLDTSK